MFHSDFARFPMETDVYGASEWSDVTENGSAYADLQFVDPAHAELQAGMTPENLTNSSVYIPQDHPVLRHLTLVSYLVTFITGVIGNGLVIFVIASHPQIRKKSVTNYYIWNLSFADLTFIFTLPFFCYATYFRNWPFGNAVCKIANTVHECNKFASVFTLVALCIDRYLASHYNRDFLRTICIGRITCVTIWVACLLTTIPYWVLSRPVTVSTGALSCQCVWPREHWLWYKTLWTYFQMVVALIVPLLLICTFSLLLHRRIRSLRRTSQSQSGFQMPSRKMTRLSLVLVISFIVCQMPYHAVRLLELSKNNKVMWYRERGEPYIPTQWEVDSFIYSNAVAQMLVFLSSVCNPFIYGIINSNYRNLYREVICRCCTDTTEDIFSSGGSLNIVTNGRIRLKFKMQFHGPCVSVREIRKKLTSQKNTQVTQSTDLCTRVGLEEGTSAHAQELERLHTAEVDCDIYMGPE